METDIRPSAAGWHFIIVGVFVSSGYPTKEAAGFALAGYLEGT